MYVCEDMRIRGCMCGCMCIYVLSFSFIHIYTITTIYMNVVTRIDIYI